jgi:hypothetical protein
MQRPSFFARAVAALATSCLFGGLLVFSLAGTASANPTFTPLTLLHGWTTNPFGTSTASVANVGGIVTLKGAIAGGLGTHVFNLPVADRPTSTVYVAADLCNSNVGRLEFLSSGAVYVNEENNKFANAKCFTSLDGVWFNKNASTTPLTLINGWTNYNASPSLVTATTSGIVRLAGSMTTSGTNAQPFVLPAGYRPPKDVFVNVDLCNSTNGRLVIAPTGSVTVEAEGGVFSNAACFTSLDGVSFATTASTFTGLKLLNGWTGGSFGTNVPRIENLGGIVALRGAMSTTGTSPDPFVIPAADRPAGNVYVPVDLCNATAGRLDISPNGTVTVEAQNGATANFTCFTSLDGASFAQ